MCRGLHAYPGVQLAFPATAGPPAVPPRAVFCAILRGTRCTVGTACQGNRPLLAGLALCAGLVRTKLCAGCGSDWSRLAFGRPVFFLEKTPPKHAAEPRDCPCRPRAPQRVGVRVGVRVICVRSGWSGPTCEVEIDHTRPAQTFVPTSPAHNGSRLAGCSLVLT